MLIGGMMTTLTEKREGMIAQELLRKQGILKQTLLNWLKVLELKIRVYREREQLLAMSTISLNDMGITRAEAEAIRSDIPLERLITLQKDSG
jgi:uncharacterized protein YjiS (DUF1127 family)